MLGRAVPPARHLARLSAISGSLLLTSALTGCPEKAAPLSSAGTPIFAVGEPAKARGLVAASFGTCAKRKDGYWCWGSIGDGVKHARPTRLPIEDVAALTLGGNHYCVLRADRHVACAGRNLDGELGDGSFTSRAELAPVPGLSDVVHVVAGSFKTCAIVLVPPGEAGDSKSKHQVVCFGTDEGQGRAGTPARRPTPMRVGDIDDARELAVEWGLACVRRADGGVWCWGASDHGRLGDGVDARWGRWPKPTSLPVRVLHVTDAVGLSAGGFGACVLTARGTVGCWGENSYGTLGDGTTGTRPDPSNVVGLEDVAQVARGGFGHACALRRDGSVWCWGYRIGDAEGAKRGSTLRSPERVPSIVDATEIASGHTHTCARLNSGAIVCWGDNSEGQLGDGTTAPSRAPREALGPE